MDIDEQIEKILFKEEHPLYALIKARDMIQKAIDDFGKKGPQRIF